MTNTDSKKVSILFSNLRGFSDIFEHHESSDIVDMLNRYFAQMNEIIAQYEGTIDKYMGDSIMAVFGIDGEREDDLLRTIACAVEMQLAMDDVNRFNAECGMPPLFMGIGINTGVVTAGLFGSHLHNEVTVIGNEVNLASRIQAQSLRGQILISEAAWQEAKDFINISQPMQIRIKGRKSPLNIYEVLSTQWPLPMDVPRREERHSPRLEMDVPFQFHILKGHDVQPELYTGRIKDMSYQGIFALIPRVVPIPEEIRLNLSLSMLSGESRSIQGKIQTAREMGEVIGCSIEFVNMNEDCQETIKNHIDRILDGN